MGNNQLDSKKENSSSAGKKVPSNNESLIKPQEVLPYLKAYSRLDNLDLSQYVFEIIERENKFPGLIIPLEDIIHVSSAEKFDTKKFIRLVAGLGVKKIDVQKKSDWLESFKNQSKSIADQLPPLIEGETVFNINVIEEKELLQTVKEVSSSNKNVVICVLDILPVVSSPEIVASLEQNNNFIFQRGEDFASEVLFKYRQSRQAVDKSMAGLELNHASFEKRSKKADEYALELKEVIKEIEGSGITTLQGIANELTRRSISSPRGNTTWVVSAVKRVKDRLSNLDKKDSPQP